MIMHRKIRIVEFSGMTREAVDLGWKIQLISSTKI